ncbi:MAG: cation:proton antiporter [Planctomycetes bacterium]|jgi:multicomponent Na+:H+ antiporter subunit D|nr:cation:proton antiporter [Planctomycetota bacterium]MDP6409157.1 monovalent cation/H+ antiporter subunit D family protein [Planctomycetota bacterium]
MDAQLPALQIVIPLLAAPLCVALRASRAAWLIAVTACWSSLAVAISLLRRVLAEGEAISYHVGGHAPPHGIELRVDALNAFVLVIVTGISAVVVSASRASLSEELPEKRHYLYFAATLLCMTGLLGMTVTGDAFNVFVFLEISSLSAYSLISMGRTRRALTAAYQYLVMGTLGGTFILLGIGLLYMATGSLNMADLAERLCGMESNRTVQAALAFIVLGASIKLALFPLHIWLPNAYAFAPAMVTAFLAATATKVAFYVLVRFLFGVFGTDFAFDAMHLDRVLMPLALLAMFSASTVAIFQRDLRRMLAFSSVAQIGYMVLGLSFASELGLAGGIVHLFNHAVIKSCLFLVMAAIAIGVGSTNIEDLRGIGRRMPLTMAAFVVGGLSLIGVPLTVGFVSKWILVRAALEAGLWPVAAMILASSLLAVVYVWRVVEVAWFQAPAEDAGALRRPPLGLVLSAWVLAAAALVFGVFTDATASVATRAARMLMEAGS